MKKVKIYYKKKGNTMYLVNKRPKTLFFLERNWMAISKDFESRNKLKGVIGPMPAILVIEKKRMEEMAKDLSIFPIPESVKFYYQSSGLHFLIIKIKDKPVKKKEEPVMVIPEPKISWWKKFVLKLKKLLELWRY